MSELKPSSEYTELEKGVELLVRLYLGYMPTTKDELAKKIAGDEKLKNALTELISKYNNESDKEENSNKSEENKTFPYPTISHDTEEFSPEKTDTSEAQVSAILEEVKEAQQKNGESKEESEQNSNEDSKKDKESKEDKNVESKLDVVQEIIKDWGNLEGIKQVVENGEIKPVVQEDKGNKSKRVLIGIFLTLSILLMGISCWLALNRKTVLMSYNVPEKDNNIIKVEDTEPIDNGLEDYENQAFIICEYDVYVDIASKQASLLFENPSTSQMNLVLHLKVNDTEVATSGLIEPGYKIELLEDVNTDSLSVGDSSGMLCVDYYDPISGEKSIVGFQTDVLVHIIGDVQ